MNLRRKIQWFALVSILFFGLAQLLQRNTNTERRYSSSKFEFKPIFAFTNPPNLFVVNSYVVVTRQSLVTILLHENDKKHFLNQTISLVNPETEYDMYCNFEDGTQSRAVHMVWNHDESGRFFECRLSEDTLNLYRSQGYLKVDILDKKSNQVLMPIKASSVLPPPSPRATTKKHFLTICGPPMRKPYPYIDEWIEYNKIIGVDKIILHACQADKNDIFNTSGIRRNVKEGFVDLQNWCPPGIVDRKRSMQPSLYLDFLYRYMDHTEWVAIIDPDEYIDPINNLTILPLLHKYSGKKVSALRLQNMFYGPCPEEEKDESKLVIERFTYRAKKAHGRYMAGLPKYHRSKNIYNTEHLFWPSVHFAVYGAPDFVPDAYKEARLNHFYCANRVRRAPEVEINVAAPNFSKKYAQLIKDKLK